MKTNSLTMFRNNYLDRRKQKWKENISSHAGRKKVEFHRNEKYEENNAKKSSLSFPPELEEFGRKEHQSFYPLTCPYIPFLQEKPLHI